LIAEEDDGTRGTVEPCPVDPIGPKSTDPTDPSSGDRVRTFPPGGKARGPF